MLGVILEHGIVTCSLGMFKNRFKLVFTDVIAFNMCFLKFSLIHPDILLYVSVSGLCFILFAVFLYSMCFLFPFVLIYKTFYFYFIAVHLDQDYGRIDLVSKRDLLCEIKDE